MWPVLATLLRTNAPLVMLPVTFTVGFIGYNIESWLSNRSGDKEEEISVGEKRKQRTLQEILDKQDQIESITQQLPKKPIFITKTDKNE